MKRPRYTTGSVTGYMINGETKRLPTHAKPRTTWYVMDSAFGYRVVKTFEPVASARHYRLPNGAIIWTEPRKSAEEKARAFADELNERDEAARA